MTRNIAKNGKDWKHWKAESTKEIWLDIRDILNQKAGRKQKYDHKPIGYMAKIVLQAPELATLEYII